MSVPMQTVSINTMCLDWGVLLTLDPGVTVQCSEQSILSLPACFHSPATPSQDIGCAQGDI